MNIEYQLQQALFFSAKENFPHIIEILLENDPNAHEDNKEALVHADNEEALKLAVQGGNTDALQMLLSYGAKASVEQSQILCQAVADNKYEVATMLLDAGADACTDDNDPLRIACAVNNAEMVMLLIKHGADAKDNRCASSALRNKNNTIMALLDT